MKTEEFGFLLGQAVIETKDKWLVDISKIVGKVDGDISKEYLALLMWTETWIVSRTLGQYAEPTLNAMHAFLYDTDGGEDKTKLEAFLNDRYAGYYAAIEDKSGEGEGARLLHVAKYFLSGCRNSGSPLIYKRLIPDLKDFEEMIKTFGGRPDVIPKLKDEIEEDVSKMTQVVTETFTQIKNMPYDKALDEFAIRVATLLKGTRLDITDPVGHEVAGHMMLHMMAAKLLKMQNDPARFQKELVASVRAWVEPPTHPLDISKATSIISHFAGFAKSVESLISDFVKEL